jgi:cytochrome c553
MRIQMVFGVLAVVTALAAPAMAAEALPDPSTSREFTAKLSVCNACHGANGVPRNNAVIPVIWGQQEGYLSKQLHDFETGERNVEVMKWMTETLTEPERRAATAYFAKQKWPAKTAAAAPPAPPRGIAVCQACHQQNFLGLPQAEGMTTPRLAGQNYEYLVESMRRFADGERTNNADMVQIMKGISPADREAMARYLASL